MSVRETPKSNRYLDLKEKERAYRKHMEAVANARPTIDTSTPDCPNRLKVKEKADAHYRRQLLTDYSKRERMIASAKDGKRSNQEVFPDNYYPDDDDEIDFDELVKKYGGELYPDDSVSKGGEASKNNIAPEKAAHKTEKIHFGDGKVHIEEEDADDITKNLDDILNDNVDELVSSPKSQNKEKNTPSQKSRASSKIPVPKKTIAKSSPKNDEKDSKKKKDDKATKSSKKETIPDPRAGLLNSSLDEKKLSSSAKKKTLGNTASSTMSFGDDFEDDFENDDTTDTEKENFDEPASDSESESTDNKFEEEKNESSTLEKSEDFESSLDVKKKVLSLTEQESSELDKTEPMTNPIAKLAEDKNSDDIPELDFPDF